MFLSRTPLPTAALAALAILATCSTNPTPRSAPNTADLKGRPDWYELGGWVYHEDERLPAEQSLLDFHPDPEWFRGKTLHLTEKQYQALLTKRGVEGAFGTDADFVDVSDPPPMPASPTDLPMSSQVAILALSAAPDADPAILNLSLSLRSFGRTIYREVEHRYTNVLPCLFAVYVDGQAARRLGTSNGRMGGIASPVELVTAGGTRDWHLRIRAASLAEFLPDRNRHHVALVAAFSERQYEPVVLLDGLALADDYNAPATPQILIRSNIVRLDWTGSQWQSAGAESPLTRPEIQSRKARPNPEPVTEIGIGRPERDPKDPSHPIIRMGYSGTSVTDAGLTPLESMKKLQSVEVANTHITDAALKHLTGLTQIQELYLDGTQVTDVGLGYIKGLTQLKKLGACCTNVTDAGLVNLEGMTHLESLSLDNTVVSDAGLRHLKGLTRLRRIDLTNTQITGAGLACLTGCTQLEFAQLDSTKVDDTGLKYLQGLTKLQTLFLGNTAITDAGLKYLEPLTQLQILDLTGTPVTDAGLAHLRGLKNLTTLYLNKTRVTRNAVDELRAALPHCAITAPEDAP